MHSAQALVVLLCVFLSNITNLMYNEQLREMVPPLSRNTVGVCNNHPSHPVLH
jgi:hypothetical protein